MIQEVAFGEEGTMLQFVWLFPLLFLFHDMEEIIGFGIWLDRNQNMLEERYPKISRTYRDYSTEGMALAVFEEFMVCIFFCTLAVVIQVKSLWLFWLGAFIVYALHLVIHIGQSIVIKQYIPSLITSITALPVSIWVILQSISELHCTIGDVVGYSVLGLVVVGGNLKFAQSLIGRFTRWKECL